MSVKHKLYRIVVLSDNLFQDITRYANNTEANRDSNKKTNIKNVYWKEICVRVATGRERRNGLYIMDRPG